MKKPGTPKVVKTYFEQVPVEVVKKTVVKEAERKGPKNRSPNVVRESSSLKTEPYSIKPTRGAGPTGALAFID
ncbi:MAG TPA: hypothetical protein VJM31_07565 [Vicinamibacterales bacterium]|nr:hypothetical protein [Vicinamibacterales bacterium]